MVEGQAQSVGTRHSPENMAGVRLKPHTCSKGTERFWCDLVTGLGAIELQRLSPAQLNAFYRDLLTRGRRNTPGGLAPKTVRYIHSILHRALRDAVRWGFVVRNVADAADPPKPRTPEMQVWSPDQLRAFLNHVQVDRLYAAWLLAVTTGMRRGEILGVALERSGPGGRSGGGSPPADRRRLPCRSRSRRRPRVAARLPSTRRRLLMSGCGSAGTPRRCRTGARPAVRAGAGPGRAGSACRRPPRRARRTGGPRPPARR